MDNTSFLSVPPRVPPLGRRGSDLSTGTVKYRPSRSLTPAERIDTELNKSAAGASFRSEYSDTSSLPVTPVSPNIPVFPAHRHTFPDAPIGLHRSGSLDTPVFPEHRHIFPDAPVPPDATRVPHRSRSLDNFFFSAQRYTFPNAPVPPDAPVPPLLDQQAKKRQKEVFTSVVSDLTDESKRLIDEMSEYGDGADKLYQRFKDNPGELLQNHDTKKGEEARLYNEHVEVVNQTIAWYHLEGIKQMSKLLLGNRRGFAEVRQWISQACEGQARLKQTENFDTLFDTISSQLEQIDKRKEEIKAHLDFLDKLQPTNTNIGFASRQWQAGKVKEFGQQAAKRAEELEGVLNQLQDYRKSLLIYIDTIYQQGKRPQADLTTLENFAKRLQTLKQAISDAKDREDSLKNCSEETNRLLTTDNKIERANDLNPNINKEKETLKGRNTAFPGNSLDILHRKIGSDLRILSEQKEDISRITGEVKSELQEENIHSYNHIINKLKDIKNGFLTEASEKKENKARGHFIWFLKYNHATINKVWTDMTCIKGFKRRRSNPKNIEVLFRSDITAFAEHRDSRDASRIQQQAHKVKTLEDREIRGDNFHLTVKIPGNNYQNDERKHGIVSLTKNIDPKEFKNTKEVLSSMEDSLTLDPLPIALQGHPSLAEYSGIFEHLDPEISESEYATGSASQSKKPQGRFHSMHAAPVQSPDSMHVTSDYFQIRQKKQSTSLPKHRITRGSDLISNCFKLQTEIQELEEAHKSSVLPLPEQDKLEQKKQELREGIDKLKSIRHTEPDKSTPQDIQSNDEFSATEAGMHRSMSTHSMASSLRPSRQDTLQAQSYLAEVATKAGGRASNLNAIFTYSRPKASKISQEDIEQIHQFIGDMIKSGETPPSDLLIKTHKFTGLRTVRSVIGNVETEIKILDMERTRSLDIVKNLVNEKGVPTSVDVEINRRVLPEPIFDIDAAQKKGPGYGMDDMEQMRCIVDLGAGNDKDDPGVLRIYNREIPLNIIDFTETKFDPRTLNTSIQFQGEKGVARINLNIAASKTLFDVDGEAKLKSELVAHASKSIDGLIQAIATQNPDLMRRALEFVEKDDDLRASQIATIKKKLEAPPRTEQEFEEAKKKALQTSQWLGEIAKSAKEMVQATQNHNEKLKEPIQAIHEKKPLSNQDLLKAMANPVKLLKSMADPVKHALMKHPSSKQKLEYRKLRDATEHLDTRYTFKFKKAPWDRHYMAMNRQLTGLELLQEYDRYTGESFIKEGKKLNWLQQLDVRTYTQQIKNFICDPANGVHSYYKNLMNLRGAIEVYDNTDTKATEEYIRRLDEGIAPLPSDNLDLDGHRRIDEAGWVNYLKQMVVKAHELGTPELLKSALSYVKWMRTAKYINLEIATKCLDLDTTTDEAKQLLGKMRIKEVLSEYEQEEQSDVATKAKSKDKSKLELKSPDEAMKEMLDSTHLHIQNLIDSTSDLALKQTYREMSPKLMEQMLSHKKELYTLNQRIDYEWLKLDEGVKKMRKLEWENFWRSLIYFWISKVGDATKHIGHAWNRFFNLFFPGGGIFK